MKAATFAQAGEQVKDGLSDIAVKIKDLSEDITDQWNDARDDLHRRAKKIRIAGEDKLHEARHRIKTHPLAVVSAVAAGAFLLGVVTGWAGSNHRR